MTTDRASRARASCPEFEVDPHVLPPSRGRAGQRRARHRRHDPQHRAAAPGDARHACASSCASTASASIAADPVIGYMHRGYEKLTEFRTYPQITTLINRIDWLSSFANEVPFISRGRACSWASRRRRARCGSAPRSPSCRASRRSCCSSARWDLQVGAITPAFYGFRDREYVLNLIEACHRRPLPPQLQPHRRLQGRPAVGLDRRVPQQRMNEGARRRATSSRTSSPATRSSSSAPARSASSRADLGARYGVSGSNLRARAVSTGTSAATASQYLPYDDLDWKVWTHPDGDSFARYWVRLQETRESARMVLQLHRQHAERPDHGQGAAHHQGARGRGLGEHREPARRDGLLRRLEGRDRPVPREDPLARRSATSRSCRGCCAACTSPTSSRSSRASTSSWETSTGERSSRSMSAGARPSRSRR